MIKQRMNADVSFTVKLNKDDIDKFQEFEESIYLALEKDLRNALKKAGFSNPTVRID